MAPLKKKILCISVMEHWGGGEEFLLKLYENIKEYEFVVASPPGESSDKFTRAGMNVVNIKCLKKFYRTGNKWSFSSRLKILFRIKISTIGLIKVILKHRIDFILCNGSLAGLYSLPAAVLTAKKFIVVQHLIYEKDSPEGKVLRLLNKFASKLVCISAAVKENAAGILGNELKDNLVIIYHGIGLPMTSENLERENKNRISIGVIGSIIRLKGIDLIIDSLKDAIKKNHNVHINLFGGVRQDEPDSLKYNDEIYNMIETCGINDNVHFCGFESNKNKLYRDIDIVVNYSTVAESFSLTVLEAMSYGKIVVAAELGGPKEIIINGYNGFLVEPANPVRLRECLEACIEQINSVEFEAIRKNARSTVEEKFSLDQFTDAYKNLFNIESNIR